MASVVWAFTYRLAILSKKAAALTSKCGIAALVLSQVFYETPTLLPFGISTRDTTAVQNAVFQQYPRIVDVYDSHSCASTSLWWSPFTAVFLCACVLQPTVTVSLISWIVCMSFRKLRAQRQLMSTKTYKLHRKLLVSLIFQVLVPACTICIPFAVLSFLVIFQVEHQE
ncbi:hypothetical protein AAVH_39819, partial [Aphelenchoides avenae]